ncbi:hypoxanthine phosphoribosyltransferase [Candidatus Collierbacteria bacterium]|nr:hypoxanthine phosphoribosyltransferase [Candidatus Collierbacteria bacterium]
MISSEAKPEFIREILLTAEQIQLRVKELSSEIAEKYRGQHLLLVGVLKGAFILTADLCRELHRAGLTDLEIDFMTISSYDDKIESSRNPRFTKDVDANVSGRRVLLIEDIIETGYSLAALQAIFLARGVASLETLVLLSKPHKREIEVPVEYIGFEVREWVEGMGLDTNQSGRANPDIVKVTKI